MMQKTAATFASSCTQQPPKGEGGGTAVGRGGWGCGGRFSNNYIELRRWWVAMVTAVPSVSYDWKQPGNRAMQPGSLFPCFVLCASNKSVPWTICVSMFRWRQGTEGEGGREGSMDWQGIISARYFHGFEISSFIFFFSSESLVLFLRVFSRRLINLCKS